MSALSRVKRLHRVLVVNVFQTNGTLEYDRIQEGFISLCTAIKQYNETHPDMSGDLECIGECDYDMFDMVEGAYWHFSEWHEGQFTKSYETLCALGSLFKPNHVSGPRADSQELDTYNQLQELAKLEVAS